MAAATFGGGFVVHKTLLARRITVPVQLLFPWDDEHVDRQSAPAFDAFASKEKTLHANQGDHRTMRVLVPQENLSIGDHVRGNRGTIDWLPRVVNTGTRSSR